MINYCIPTYRCFEYCKQAILTAMRSSLAPDKYIIIDNSGDGSAVRYLYDVTTKYSNVFIWPQAYNLGVARSFNLFMSQLEDDVIIANDDVFVHPHTISAIITMAHLRPVDILFAGSGHSGNAFSFFLLKKKGFLEIGPFDEHFYPGYYEDNDYAYRMKLAGYTIIDVPSATYDHIGSATIRTYDQVRMNQHHNEFNRNTNYYKNKWGGLPGNETYVIPFGEEI